jgi:hypothetical protein
MSAPCVYSFLTVVSRKKCKLDAITDSSHAISLWGTVSLEAVLSFGRQTAPRSRFNQKNIDSFRKTIRLSVLGGRGTSHRGKHPHGQQPQNRQSLASYAPELDNIERITLSITQGDNV